ncbi:MAG: aminoacyl-tRNA hydrolase, partial [Candidatus Omnitrophica bacterium]|nr:aminoacyl-tRNA hydrolase [Candidatus Omnitrophota bacterium]
MMKIIAGLGNPGFRYRNTRHNIGFRVLEAFAEKHRCRIKRKAFRGIYGTGVVSGQEVMLFKPLTYMNLSGEAVGEVCSSRFGGKSDLLVVSDDLNLPLGVLRLREKGSAGGHNGLRSIGERIGADFSRLRVGIGGQDVSGDMTSFVLSPFPRRDRPLLEDAVKK